MLSNTFSSSRVTLAPQKELDITAHYLEGARKFKDQEISLVFCHDADAALSRVKKAVMKALATPMSTADQTLLNDAAAAYHEHGQLLEGLGHNKMAQVSYKKAEKLGYVKDSGQQTTTRPSQRSNNNDIGFSSLSILPSNTLSRIHHRPSASSPGTAPSRDIAHIQPTIFSQDVTPAVAKYEMPIVGTRLTSTPQLTYCLTLLSSQSSDVQVIDDTEIAWVKATENDEDEQDRLHTIATDLIKAFINDVLKPPAIVAEVVYLAPALDKEQFRRLLMNFIDGINQATLLEIHLLEGLAQLMQCASPEYLDADDLVKILDVLSTRLKDTHQQSTQHIYKLTLAVSHVLDAMADCQVKELSREQLHEPLSDYLNGLKDRSDPYLVYQAAYAFQALQYVPDDESPLQATIRRANKLVKGISGIVSAVKGLDVNGFIDGLSHLQDGILEVYQVAKIGYEGAMSLIDSGQDLFNSLKDGLSFAKKRSWYPALRVIDSLIQLGQLAKVKKLICEVPFRRDVAFQWGVCQRLGEIASNPLWDVNTRQSAVDFLGEMYKNDAEWGQQAVIKQWIVTILEQLASQTESKFQSAGPLLVELTTDGDVKKQGLYQTCRENPQIQYKFSIAISPLASTSLLDRVQNKTDIEASLRQLRDRRLKEQSDAVYIPPQAKPSAQSPDEELFSLMDKVKEFLGSDQKVMLLLGDSGAGKSTFNRALECDLWNKYKKKDGLVPLFISLAAIDKPEQDLVAKHLRRSEFSEPQIRELKDYRSFILICDGYDESQQTHNLYMSNRLNQLGEWKAQMVISCRSEYIGLDYRDRFQPSDQNMQPNPELFQEAVIASFSTDQIHDYIERYVFSKRPLWQVNDYLHALDQIPSLQDLVKNPFMLTLTLDVLPRMVSPEQDLTDVQISRVSLYDQFVEQWLERGKKRLVEKKDLSYQEKKVFESLSDDGFAQNGVEFLGRLAVAIYTEQGGNPVVKYSHFRHQQTWKNIFFGKDDEKQLLREACPLVRNGNQYRFIHKSLLEYCLARAVFEPQEKEVAKHLPSMQSASRRGSVHSILSFESQGDTEEPTLAIEQVVRDSPLMKKNYVGEPSIIQFLAERVQHEPHFKQQLYAMIECSKVDKEARKAAANAITILIRSGERFNGADLRGIQIPGADLSGGQFDHAQLQGADLRKTNLRNTWLRQADLSNARMSGVQFGEWPYLQEDFGVISFSFSPDGKTCVLCTADTTICVYDSALWMKIHTLRGHTGLVLKVTYSPSGHQIVSASSDMTLRLWDAQSGVFSNVFEGHTNEVSSVAYSPSGHQIASGSYDSTVRLWDAQTGVCSNILKGHTDKLTSVAYSPSGDKIATGSHDNTVRLWDPHTGDLGLVLSGHTDQVTVVAYSPSGHQIASASIDKSVRLWDAQTGASTQVLNRDPMSVFSITYSPSGHQIASGCDDYTVRLWDAKTCAPGPILSGHTGYITSVAYSPNGLQIASAGWDETVRLWDAQIASLGPASQGHTDHIFSMKFSPSGLQIASVGKDETIRLWDAQTGAPGLVLRGHSGIVSGVAYSPSGHQIASAGWDMTVRLWNAQTSAPGHILSGHTEIIVDMTYSPNGLQVASGSDDGSVRLWNVQTGELDLIISGGQLSSVISLAYSPSGHQIVLSSGDKSVQLWDAHTGAPGNIMNEHDGIVICVTYSPDGLQIASASHDYTVILWDAQTGASISVLRGHSREVLTTSYSPNGRWIASGSWDDTVRLWDVDSSQCLAVLDSFPGGVSCVSWSIYQSGTYFATTSGKSIHVWKVVEEKDNCQVQLQWKSMHNSLIVSNAMIENVEGLSKVNMQLVKQRGALGKPIQPLSFRDVGKVISNMASVASNFKPIKKSAEDLEGQESATTQQNAEQQINKVAVLQAEE